MKRIIGIILIVVGILFGVMALNRHEDDNTLIDLGKVELKKQDKSPSQNTTLYYILAGVCVIGGGVLLAGKRA